MHIRPIMQEDLPDIADVGIGAFARDGIFTTLHPLQHKYPRDFRGYVLNRGRTRFLKPGCYGLVCVSDRHDGPTYWNGQEEILGYAFWERFGDASKDTTTFAWQSNNSSLAKLFERFALGLKMHYNELIRLDRSRDDEAIKVFAAQPSLHDHFGPLGACWHLEVLATDVKHGRRGVGGLLLDWGIENAKREGVPAAVAASVQGEGLYRKRRFRSIDYAVTGLEQVEGHCLMILDNTGDWVRPAEESEKFIERGGKTVEVDVVWK